MYKSNELDLEPICLGLRHKLIHWLDEEVKKGFWGIQHRGYHLQRNR